MKTLKDLEELNKTLERPFSKQVLQLLFTEAPSREVVDDVYEAIATSLYTTRDGYLYILVGGGTVRVKLALTEK